MVSYFRATENYRERRLWTNSKGNSPKTESDIPLPRDTSQSLLRDTKTFPIIHPASWGSASASPLSGTSLDDLQSEAPRRHPNEMLKPPQLTQCGGAAVLLFSDVAPHPSSKAEHGLSWTHALFGLLYPRPCSFGHAPYLTTLCEGWNTDEPVSWQLCLLTQLFLHHKRSEQSLITVSKDKRHFKILSTLKSCPKTLYIIWDRVPLTESNLHPEQVDFVLKCRCSVQGRDSP